MARTADPLPCSGNFWKAARRRPRIGGLYIGQAKGKEAIQAFERAFKLVPRSPEVGAGLAHSYAQAGQPEDADKWFKKASDLI